MASPVASTRCLAFAVLMGGAGGAVAEVSVVAHASIDPAVAWHGRMMVLAWVVLLPLGVLVARFFKVFPGQDWPLELDNQGWWRSHLWLQWAGAALAVAALATVVLLAPGGAAGAGTHRLIGWSVLALLGVQVAGGIARGTKGGPPPAEPGDHYAMTRYRVVFERVHKSVGYLAIVLANVDVALGLRIAGAPEWMWSALVAWWLTLVAAFAWLQRSGRCVDTYQAIWGPDPRHPGNRRKPIGWGVRRPAGWHEGALARPDGGDMS